MRYLLIALGLLLSFQTLAQEEIEYKKYSYTQLFQMIKSSRDTIFKLENAEIVLHADENNRFQIPGFGDAAISQDTIFVNKILDFKNVVFKGGHFSYIAFMKDLSFFNATPGIYKSRIVGKMIVRTDEPFLSNAGIGDSRNNMHFIGNKIENRFIIDIGDKNQEIDHLFRFNANTVSIDKVQFEPDAEFGTNQSFFNVAGINQIEFQKNKIDLGDAQLLVASESTYWNEFLDNSIAGNGSLAISLNKAEHLNFKRNSIHTDVYFGVDALNEKYKIHWPDLSGRLINVASANQIFLETDIQSFDSIRSVVERTYDGQHIREILRIQNLDFYNNEKTLFGLFYNHYRSIHNTDWANMVYVEMKDLETARLGYLYQQNPSFDTFFTLQINRFLKVFSNYGTRPSKAIIFSVYVILAFALVYLFFPNYWDSHGKNRIMDRYRFFLKYVNKDSGMHEVYLDEKKPELLASEDFKVYLQEQGKTAPRFFMATALPLYRWSVAGTKSASWLLSKVDVLKGKWSDTDNSKRGGKSFLLITAFLIALTYDIFIKMLNALMLSINTFTTLGFGEIPIKGLPRYLAIIQGFIGWFMLTIFSVSLISQLLN